MERDYEDFQVRFGLGCERDFVDDDTQVGIELVPQYAGELLEMVAFETQAETFYAVIERQFSIESSDGLETSCPAT